MILKWPLFREMEEMSAKVVLEDYCDDGDWDLQGIETDYKLLIEAQKAAADSGGEAGSRTSESLKLCSESNCNVVRAEEHDCTVDTVLIISKGKQELRMLQQPAAKKGKYVHV